MQGMTQSGLGTPGASRTGSDHGLAGRIVHLAQLALRAQDLSSGIVPTLEALITDTAAVGSAYFHLEAQDLTFRVQAAAGELPDTPAMQAIATHGLPSGTPLLEALRLSPAPLFFADTAASGITAGFPELGVVSLAAAPVLSPTGELIGAFLMHTFTPHLWQPDEQTLFGSVSATLATLAGRLTAEQQAREAREAALRALGLALETRDRETQGHTDRVTALAERVARRLNWPEERLHTLRWGAYLHDIGKIAVPDSILLKRGTLDDAERLEMQEHVREGLRFALALSFLPPQALHVIRDHHERWDGRGYPHGTRGEAISEEGRVFALCDVYDALTSERPYKPAWTAGAALAELRAQTGRQFDPALVSVFVDLIESELADAPLDVA
ncbi:phosphohydrolase [Deinococcus radiotolerans]|uniref:Phosphohydrolase n=2 Tax=Deinococcus radiotolerans TaxID=1309407 RepID=A0ABQ2FJI4_9DEIO|nr:phosphohydrolase [Deinococcus radiotolerans]